MYIGLVSRIIYVYDGFFLFIYYLFRVCSMFVPYLTDVQ